MCIYFLIRVVRLCFLIIININLFIRDNLASLIKERRSNKLIINYIYKSKIFKLNFILFFYIY